MRGGATNCSQNELSASLVLGGGAVFVPTIVFAFVRLPQRSARGTRAAWAKTCFDTIFV